MRDRTARLLAILCGLAVAVAECCVSGEFQGGARLTLEAPKTRMDQLLFNESQSRIVVSVAPGNVTAALALLQWRGVAAQRIGVVGGPELAIETGKARFAWTLEELRHAWQDSLADIMAGSR